MLKNRKNTVGPVPDGCPLDEVLALLGSVWTPRILWYLRGEPRRFAELKRDLGRISAKVLSDRLTMLAHQGLVSRRKLATSPPSVEYTLTEAGKKMRPVLDAMEQVARNLRET